ncbi:MAG: nickel-type superoxide dismutase maturation protease [Acidimicrobiales bacterium]
MAARLARPLVIPVLLAGCVAWLWSRCATSIEVDGSSMLPSLEPSDRLLVARTIARRPGQRLRAGDVAVVRDPERPGRLLVKRVESNDETGLLVVGDNRGASRDSRHFGVVPDRLIVGRAWYRYAPTRSAGRLDRGRRRALALPWRTTTAQARQRDQ